MSSIITSVDLTDSLYQKFRKLVYDQAGINLGDAKRELVRSRLLKRLRALSIPTFEAYYEFISKNDPKGQELTHLLDAISTNKTDFFRENQHFIFLKESVLPALFKKLESRGDRRIRIWSAGCSSGEEPYTLALLLHDTVPDRARWDVKILATDLSTRVLEAARTGLYEERKVAPVPPQMRSHGFTKEKTPKGTFFRVRPEIRQLITFRRLNLISGSYPFKSKFDVIFCRNVMIYFDRATQEALVNRFSRYLQPGGHLFIGHSESLNSLKTPFRFVKPTIYLNP